MNSIKLEKYLLYVLLDCCIIAFGFLIYDSGTYYVSLFEEIKNQPIEKWQAIPWILFGFILLIYHTINYFKEKNK